MFIGGWEISHILNIPFHNFFCFTLNLCYIMIGALIGTPFKIIGSFVLFLYAFQLIVQIIQILARYFSGDPVNYVTLFGHEVLGLTGLLYKRWLLFFGNFHWSTLTFQKIQNKIGEAVPNKPFLRHNLITYNLVIWATIVTIYHWNFFESLGNGKPILAFIIGVSTSFVIKSYGYYTIFKLYPEGYGAGLNLYYNGWRILGLDWHQWQVRQDIKTGKPLKPEDQYLLNRPHIDIPPWEMHHWPWVTRPTNAQVELVKQAKSEIRAQRQANKEAKKLRRAAVLATRTDNTATPEILPLESPKKIDTIECDDCDISETVFNTEEWEHSKI